MFKVSSIIRSRIFRVPAAFLPLATRRISPLFSLRLQKQTICQRRYSIATGTDITSSDAQEDPPSLRTVLSDEAKEVSSEMVQFLTSIVELMNSTHASEEHVDLLKKSLAHAQTEAFMLVVVGEFNSGKSSFLNALLGGEFLDEGITPTTSSINVIKYGEKHEMGRENEDRELTVRLPLDWLKEISVVDTPGTNAVIQGHQRLTEEFVPRCDMVLFVTSCDRAFSESERAFLAHIKEWRKKIVVVLSKIDTLPDDSRDNLIDEVVQFIESNMKTLLDIDNIVVFPVSAKQALMAKSKASAKTGKPARALWRKSRFEPLQEYILETLDNAERTKLKLLTPLGVASTVISAHSDAAKVELELLKSDLDALSLVSQHMKVFESDVRREYEGQIVRLENVLLELEQRANVFFDKNLSLLNIMELVNSDRMQQRFASEVVADSAREIETRIQDMADWLSKRAQRQWAEVFDIVRNNVSRARAELVTSGAASDSTLRVKVEGERSRLLTDATRSVMNEVMDKDREAAKLGSALRVAVFSTAAVEVGAVGVATLLASSVFDFTGMLGASAIAVSGLAILPYRRRTLKLEMVSRTNELRERIRNAMKNHFEREMEATHLRINDALKPFTLFVNGKVESLNFVRSQSEEHLQRAEALRRKIEQLK